MIQNSFLFMIPLIDLRKIPINVVSSEIEANHLANEEAKHPFDLKNGPIFRVNTVILPLQSQSSSSSSSSSIINYNRLLLLLNVHHIASDGWSISIFTKEMGLLYQYFSNIYSLSSLTKTTTTINNNNNFFFLLLLLLLDQ